MAGLVPAIHAIVSLQSVMNSLPHLGEKLPERRRLFSRRQVSGTAWMAGARPAMTERWEDSALIL